MDLSRESTEKLGNSQAMLQKLLKVFAVLGLIIAITLYILKAKLILFVPVFVLPVTFLPIVLQLQAIKAELKSRSLANPN